MAQQLTRSNTLKKYMIYIGLGIGLLPMTALAYMEGAASGEMTSWLVALVSLLVAGGASLYLFTTNTHALEQKYQLAFASHQEDEQKQQTVLSLIQHKIEVTTRELARHCQVFESRPPETISPDVIREKIAHIRSQEVLLLDAAQNLKDFLQIQLGRLQIQMDEFVFDNMLKEIFGSLRPQLRQWETELIYTYQNERIVKLKGDTRRIEQIVRTMIETLLPYSQKKSLTVQVRRENNAINVEFAIENGTFPESSIVQPEVLLSHLEGEQDEGRLKLYIAYELVHQMGGEIQWLDNGYGAVLRMTLPVTQMETRPVERITCDYNVVAIQHSAEALRMISDVFDPSCRTFKGFTFTLAMPIPLEEMPMDLLVIDHAFLVGDLLEALRKRQSTSAFEVIVLDRYPNEAAVLPDGLKILKRIVKPVMPDQWSDLFRQVSIVGQRTAEPTAMPPESPLELSAMMAPRKIPTVSTREILPEVLDEVPNIHYDDFKQFHYLYVLVAEDNQLNQKILQGIFTHSGIKVFQARHGQEALEILEANPEIDLVLMDANMPVMDGYEATRQIRQQYSPKELPVIVIENAGFEYTDKHDAGFNAVLQKPFRIGQFYRAFELYGTRENAKIKFVGKKLTKYEAKPDILDIDAGIKNFITAILYRETLKEVLVTLRGSRKTIEGYLDEKAWLALVGYIDGLVSLAKTVGAKTFHQRLTHLRELCAPQEADQQILQEALGAYCGDLKTMISEAESYLQSAELI
jgi:CheY-like chemotaxis protein